MGFLLKVFVHTDVLSSILKRNLFPMAELKWSLALSISQYQRKANEFFFFLPLYLGRWAKTLPQTHMEKSSLAISTTYITELWKQHQSPCTYSKLWETQHVSLELSSLWISPMSTSLFSLNLFSISFRGGKKKEKLSRLNLVLGQIKIYGKADF